MGRGLKGHQMKFDAKEYLLGLLDGSQSLSNEGIGLVVDQLQKLNKVFQETISAKPYFNHLINDGTYWIVEGINDAAEGALNV